ncbi:MAG: M48 family metalloprotease [Cytophagales bacterium]|nr:M48 family metalloprotease [Cytophagales bacterium]
MKSKQLLILVCFALWVNDLMAQEFDEDRLTLSERQSLIRILQKRKNLHRPNSDNLFDRKIRDLHEKRTQFLVRLIKHNLLITPGSEFQRIQFLFDSLKTSDLIKRKESQLLIMRSPIPNAFCVGEGTIAVTTGLLEIMDTDEQVTWVLGHELAHYELDHANQHLRGYARRHSSLSRRQKQELSDPDKNISLETLNAYKEMAFGLGKFKRKDEFEADSLGHLIFQDLKQPGYIGLKTLNTLDSAFEEQLPYHIDKIFNFRDYPFQKFWFKNRPSFFSRIPSSSLFPDDSTKSHPAMAERISKLDLDFGISQQLQVSIKTTPLDKSYALENLKSAYSSKNYDFLIFLAAKYYRQKEYRYWIVRLVSAALFELYQLKGEPDFPYLVSPFTYQYGEHLTQVNNFLHNARPKDLLTIGFLFLNDGRNFNPKDESHFFMLWKYARAMDDFRLMNNIRRTYQEYHDDPKYLSQMRQVKY